ncbi:MAG TPA: VOC family protein [Puia sp.]|nr:VOC family protein [Puia sp.]
MKNAIDWFQIPVLDMDRAIKFYNSIFSAHILAMDIAGAKVAPLPYDRENGGVGGALYLGAGFVPSHHGTVVLLNAGNDLSEVLSRVEEAGGQIVLPKTGLTNNSGFMARFIDCEGNLVGLHSLN